MSNKYDIYVKVKDVVRQQGHSESESCRIFKDWHIELRVGTGHVSVWTSDGMVYLTMLDKPVHYRAGAWEEHLSRLHQGRPLMKPVTDLRELLRTQALDSEEVIDTEDASPSEDAADADTGESELAKVEVAANDMEETREPVSASCANEIHPPEAPIGVGVEVSNLSAEQPVAIATNGASALAPEVIVIDEDDFPS